MKTQSYSATGVILENLPNTMFRVRITNSEAKMLVEQVILCTLSGKMRINWVRLLPGDQVQMEISPLDTSKGRITYKLK